MNKQGGKSLYIQKINTYTRSRKYQPELEAWIRAECLNDFAIFSFSNIETAKVEMS